MKDKEDSLKEDFWGSSSSVNLPCIFHCREISAYGKEAPFQNRFVYVFLLQIMDGPGENEPDLIPATHPRFCEAIKSDMPPYSTLFTRVFKNKTFNVYKLKKLKKKNKAENGP